MGDIFFSSKITFSSLDFGVVSGGSKKKKWVKVLFVCLLPLFVFFLLLKWVKFFFLFVFCFYFSSGWSFFLNFIFSLNGGWSFFPKKNFHAPPDIKWCVPYYKICIHYFQKDPDNFEIEDKTRLYILGRRCSTPLMGIRLQGMLPLMLYFNGYFIQGLVPTNIPLNDVRAYIVWSWKTTLILWFFFLFLRGWCPPPV